MARAVWPLVALLVLAEIALSWVAWDDARGEHVVYVLTPMVDVVPSGAPLSADEAGRLSGSLRTQVDARDMQTAYAWLGSTLSLDDLLRGVASLAQSDHPLDVGQRARVAVILDAAQAQHREIVEVQGNILAAEAGIGQDVAGILAALPPDVAARIAAGRR